MPLSRLERLRDKLEYISISLEEDEDYLDFKALEEQIDAIHGACELAEASREEDEAAEAAESEDEDEDL